MKQLFLLLLGSSALQAQVILNGSFENPPISTIEAPATSLTDWTVHSDNTFPYFIYNGAGAPYGSTSFGSQYLALGGQVAPGAGVSQTVSGFTPGNQYVLSFEVGNGDNNNVASLEVLSDHWDLGTVTATGPAPPSVGWFNGAADPITWKPYDLSFTATDSTLTFTFAGVFQYPALDAVSLALVPEPGEWLSVATFGLIAFGLWRRLSSRVRPD